MARPPRPARRARPDRPRRRSSRPLAGAADPGQRAGAGRGCRSPRLQLDLAAGDPGEVGRSSISRASARRSCGSAETVPQLGGPGTVEPGRPGPGWGSAGCAARGSTGRNWSFGPVGVLGRQVEAGVVDRQAAARRASVSVSRRSPSRPGRPGQADEGQTPSWRGVQGARRAEAGASFEDELPVSLVAGQAAEPFRGDLGGQERLAAAQRPRPARPRPPAKGRAASSSSSRGCFSGSEWTATRRSIEAFPPVSLMRTSRGAGWRVGRHWPERLLEIRDSEKCWPASAGKRSPSSAWRRRLTSCRIDR